MTNSVLIQKEIELQNLLPHPLSNRPDNAWDELKIHRKYKKIDPNSLINGSYEKDEKRLRFVCISDTHCRLESMKYPIPPGDVLLHAGDFTSTGTFGEIERFNEQLGKLPHQYKIVIPGNHELSFDEKANECESLMFNYQKPKKTYNVKYRKELITNATVLIDQEIIIDGIKIYGSPWQPEFCGWAYNVDRGENLLYYWKKIPADTDILMTHGPPIGHNDVVSGGYHVGCVDLLSAIECIRPKFHVSGHIHEGYGITTDDSTVFINASICTRRYQAFNEPICFDMDKKIISELS